MTVWNNTSLNNRLLHKEAEKALHAQLISDDEWQRIKKMYPTDLYTPDLFIRIALFLLTMVCVLCCMGIVALLTLDRGSEKAAGVMVLCCAGGCYALLESFARNKKHFNSGVDDGLLFMSAVLLVSGLFLITGFPPMRVQFVLYFIIGLLSFIRFLHPVMALVCFFSLLGIFFTFTIDYILIGRFIMPFVMMVVSLVAYLFVTRTQRQEKCRYYTVGLSLVRMAALSTLYIAGNYLVVRELSIEMFQMNLKAGDPLPLGWYFWIHSWVLPFVYIWMGLRKKDAIPLHTGLVLVAVAVFTFRYYHHLIPVEGLMTLGGAFLIGFAVHFIRYLKVPKHGFTDQPAASSDETHLKAQLEALVIAETMKPAAPQEEGFQFEGGSGGGGGASGGY